MVSSYEAEARICARFRVFLNVTEREEEKRRRTDFFSWVPYDTFDILRVLHEHAHALEIRIWMHYTSNLNQCIQIRVNFPIPSQTHTVLSLLQLASRFPSLEYAMLLHSVS